MKFLTAVYNHKSSSSSSEFYCSPGFVSSQHEIQKARNVINTIAETLLLNPIDENGWSNKVSTYSEKLYFNISDAFLPNFSDI